MNETESSLVAGLKSSDPAAFEHLVRSASPRLLAAATRILGNERDAQDVVQEALISAWRSIDGFDGDSSVTTWLHRIVINGCLGKLRGSRSKNEVSLGGDSSMPQERTFAPPAMSGPTVEDRLVMRRAIDRALKLIPDELRIVLLLRDVEQLSSREVSEQLGIPDTAVRQRLHRARTIMAELLRPELCDGPKLICGGQIDLLLDYIDNALPADLQAPVAGHIAGCPACTGLLETYRITVGLPRAISELTVDEEAPGTWVSQTITAALAIA